MAMQYSAVYMRRDHSNVNLESGANLESDAESTNPDASSYAESTIPVASSYAESNIPYAPSYANSEFTNPQSAKFNNDMWHMEPGLSWLCRLHAM